MIELSLPDDFNFTSIAAQFNSLAQAYGFNIVSFNADKMADNDISQKNHFRKAKISVSLVGGTYDDLKNLLNAIENSAMIFDVNSINFSGSNSYNLEIITYYFSN